MTTYLIVTVFSDRKFSLYLFVEDEMGIMISKCVCKVMTMKLFPRKEDGKLDLKAFFALPKPEQEEAQAWLQENGKASEKMMFAFAKKAVEQDRQERHARETRSVVQPKGEERATHSSSSTKAKK